MYNNRLGIDNNKLGIKNTFYSSFPLDKPNDYCEYCGDYVAKEYSNSFYCAKCELLGCDTSQPVIEQNDCCIIL